MAVIFKWNFTNVQQTDSLWHLFTQQRFTVQLIQQITPVDSILIFCTIMFTMTTDCMSSTFTTVAYNKTI